MRKNIKEVAGKQEEEEDIEGEIKEEGEEDGLVGGKNELSVLFTVLVEEPPHAPQEQKKKNEG